MGTAAMYGRSLALLLCLVAAPSGASEASDALTAAVYRGVSVPDLVSSVLRDAKETAVPSFLQVSTVYRHESGILHQGLALLKEMKYDVNARMEEVARATAKCNKKKQDAYMRASKDKNMSEADLSRAFADLNRTDAILESASATLEETNRTTTKDVTRLQKKITEAHKAINHTTKQLLLIKKVIAVVKQMNATYHNDAKNVFTDIKPVMKMLYGIVANLRLEIDLLKRDLTDLVTKIALKEKALKSEQTAFADAEAKHSNATAKLDNTTDRLKAEIQDANERLAAIGVERSDCVKEVSADARTHEESVQVIDFIIAYFEKLLGYKGGESNVTVVAGNGTAIDSSNETEVSNSTGNVTEMENPQIAEEPVPKVVANTTEEKLTNPNGTKTGAQVMHDLVMKITQQAGKPAATAPPAPAEDEEVEPEAGVVAQKTMSVQA